MRFVGLCLLGLVAYVISMVTFFPVGPVVDYIRPQLGPVALDGVNGRLYKGVIDRVRSTDDLLPLEFSNVTWRLAPSALLKASAGVAIGFDGYGGSGKGQISRSLGGNIAVSDFTFNAQAKQLETLLPVPIASFTGTLEGNFDEVLLVNQLLERFDGTLIWQDAVLEAPVPTTLGNVSVQIKPDAEKSHLITLDGAGGDVDMQGTVTLSLNGDFTANVLFTPTNSASPSVRNGLRQMGRADAQGRVRLQRTGNLNRLM